MHPISHNITNSEQLFCFSQESTEKDEASDTAGVHLHTECLLLSKYPPK